MFEIFVIIIMSILIYVFIQKKKNNKIHHKKKIYKKKIISKNIINNDEIQKPNINSDLIEIQYHVDYSDTITAINNLTPQKELFNLAFLPVQSSKPDDDTINQLVSIFITSLNDEIKKTPQFLNVNSGWNNMNMRLREKTNQELQFESLGIPSKLYNTPAEKSNVILLRIDKAEQFNTNTQVRIEVHIIIQKQEMNVKDQMVLMVQFFMEKENNSTDNFFTQKLTYDSFKTSVLIERIFIVGFLTNKSILKTKIEKFYEYDDILRQDGTMNQEKVLKMMIQKHKDRDEALNSFTQTLDNDTKTTHFEDDAKMYDETRTIIDDYIDKYPVYE